MVEIIPNEKLKSVLISRAVKSTGLPEDVVEKIIRFQFDDMDREMRETSSSTISIYKFGKLYLSRKRADARLSEARGIISSLEVHLRSSVHGEKKRHNFEKKLRDTKVIEQYISRKL